MRFFILGTATSVAIPQVYASYYLMHGTHIITSFTHQKFILQATHSCPSQIQGCSSFPNSMLFIGLLAVAYKWDFSRSSSLPTSYNMSVRTLN